MNEAVAAEDRVRLRYPVARDVEDDERFVCAPVKFSVALDEFGHDIRADILQAFQLDMTHPVEIPARRVEQRPSADALEQSRKRFPDDSRASKGRASAGDGLRIRPPFVPVYVREDFPRIAPRESLPDAPEALINPRAARQHGLNEVFRPLNHTY